MKPLLTPTVERKLAAELEGGASTVDAARAAGIKPHTLSLWLTKGRQGVAAYVPLVDAQRAFLARLNAVDDEARGRRLDPIAHATLMLRAGASVKAAAEWAGITRGNMLYAVKRGLAGKAGFVELAEAARPRLRGAARCPHCGGSLNERRRAA